MSEEGIDFIFCGLVCKMTRPDINKINQKLNQLVAKVEVQIDRFFTNDFLKAVEDNRLQHYLDNGPNQNTVDKDSKVDYFESVLVPIREYFEWRNFCWGGVMVYDDLAGIFYSYNYPTHGGFTVDEKACVNYVSSYIKATAERGLVKEILTNAIFKTKKGKPPTLIYYADDGFDLAGWEEDYGDWLKKNIIPLSIEKTLFKQEFKNTFEDEYKKLLKYVKNKKEAFRQPNFPIPDDIDYDPLEDALRTLIESLDGESLNEIQKMRKEIIQKLELDENMISKEDFMMQILWNRLFDKKWRYIYFFPARLLGATPVGGLVLASEEAIKFEEFLTFQTVSNRLLGQASLGFSRVEARKAGELIGWRSLAGNVGHNIKNLIAPFYEEIGQGLREGTLFVCDDSVIKEDCKGEAPILINTGKVKLGFEVCYNSLIWLKIAGKGISTEKDEDMQALRDIILPFYCSVYESFLYRFPQGEKLRKEELGIIDKVKQKSKAKLGAAIFVPPVCKLEVENECEGKKLNLNFLLFPPFAKAVDICGVIGNQNTETINEYWQKSLNLIGGGEVFTNISDIFEKIKDFDFEIPQLKEGFASVFYEIFYNAFWRGELYAPDDVFPYTITCAIRKSQDMYTLRISNPYDPAKKKEKTSIPSGLFGVRMFFEAYSEVLSQSRRYDIQYSDRFDNGGVEGRSNEWFNEVVIRNGGRNASD